MILIGSLVVVTKVLTESLPIYAASCARFFLAAAVLLPFARLREIKLNSRDWRDFALVALFGGLLFNVLMLWGLARTPALIGGIITSCLPAVVALVAWIVLRETPTMRAKAGIGLAVVGSIIVAWDGQGGEITWGSVLIVAAVFAEAFYIIYSRTGRQTPVRQAFFVSFLAAWMFLPFAIPEIGEVNVAQWRDWWTVVYLGVVVTAGGFYLWFFSLRQLTAFQGGVYAALVPISAVVLSVVTLGEVLLVHHMVGGGLVIAAVLLVAWADRHGT